MDHKLLEFKKKTNGMFTYTSWLLKVNAYTIGQKGMTDRKEAINGIFSPEKPFVFSKED